MRNDLQVDVTLNAFGKPCQTALTLASLLRHSEENIRRIYLLVERERPIYDMASVPGLSAFSEKIQVIRPEYWLGIDTPNISRLREKAYRHSIRYQYAWEASPAQYLLILHNDVFFHKNIIPEMAAATGEAVITGRIGQCWNCPAARGHVVGELRINDGAPCSRERYQDFKLSFAELNRMYQYSQTRGEHCRPYAPRWSDEFRERPWPLPECRVNEVCCLVNMPLARKATVPYGKARPFGIYADAGSHNLDVGVAWFRDVHKQNLYARNFDTTDYLTHFIGHSRMFDKTEYASAENNAARILDAEFADFAAICRRAVPGLLPLVAYEDG